jgi:hypothetical protein
MKQTSIWEYIYVGTCLRFIQDQREGWNPNSDAGLVENLDTFLTSLDELGLHVTKRASSELQAIREEMAAKSKDYTLSSEDVFRAKRAATDTRKTFMAETKGVFTYVVVDKRLDVRKLLADTAALFAPNVLLSCSEIARYDFAEAGKCIAFERPTAAAFHILRGTESVVRSFYKRFIRPAQPGLTWGQMTHALATKASGKRPPPVILLNLDHIRVNFRNPTQHPEKIYDIQEAQDLFSLCVDAVNRMMPEILK